MPMHKRASHKRTFIGIHFVQLCFIQVLVIKLRALIDCGSFSVYAHTIFVSVAIKVKE